MATPDSQPTKYTTNLGELCELLQIRVPHLHADSSRKDRKKVTRRLQNQIRRKSKTLLTA